MTDIDNLLKRQADWQKSRRHLSWSEKIRLVESLHDAIRQFRHISPVKPGQSLDLKKHVEGEGGKK